MISPKPGSPAFALLSVLVRNPDTTAEQLGLLTWPMSTPLPDLPPPPRTYRAAEVALWRAEMRQAVQRREAIVAAHAGEVAARASELLGRLAAAGLVERCGPLRVASWWWAKWHGSVEAGICYTLSDNPRASDGSSAGEPPEDIAQLAALVAKVQKSPCTARALLGAHPDGAAQARLGRLQEGGIIEGGRLRRATEKGERLVEGSHA
jgi:hypothetical protein